MVTDPMANMLTQIRNSIKAGHSRVDVPASKIKAAVCKVLKEEGYIRSFKIIARSPVDVVIRIYFKDSAIVGIKRVSTPGLRVYRGYRNGHRVLSGLGISIISTSHGVVSSRLAKMKKIGGEVICDVW